MNKRKKICLSVETIKTHIDLCQTPTDSIAEGSALIQPSAELADEYLNLDTKFHNKDTNYKRQLFILEISHRVSARFRWDFKKSHKMIVEISGIFHMNLLEVTYWEILLKSIKSPVFTPLLTAYITGYQAKLDLNQDVACYEYLLNLKIPNFRILFYNWQLVRNCEPTMIELNKEYFKLNKRKRTEKNYEKIVDLLMECSKRPVKAELKLENQSEDSTLNDFEYLSGLVFSPIDTI